jgi:hypothetical protein
MYRLHMCAMLMFRTCCETEFSKMFVHFRLPYNTDSIIANIDISKKLVYWNDNSGMQYLLLTIRHFGKMLCYICINELYF